MEERDKIPFFFLWKRKRVKEKQKCYGFLKKL